MLTKPKEQWGYPTPPAMDPERRAQLERPDIWPTKAEEREDENHAAATAYHQSRLIDPQVDLLLVLEAALLALENTRGILTDDGRQKLDDLQDEVTSTLGHILYGDDPPDHKIRERLLKRQSKAVLSLALDPSLWGGDPAHVGYALAAMARK